jgi:hypothetical protein
MPILEFILLKLHGQGGFQARTEGWCSTLYNPTLSPPLTEAGPFRVRTRQQALGKISQTPATDGTATFVPGGHPCVARWGGRLWFEREIGCQAGAMAGCCAVSAFGNWAAERPCIAVGF